jgi:hypothetical protein
MSRSALLVGLLVLGAAALSPSIAAATPDQTVLVSRGLDGRAATGQGFGAEGPTITPDGQRVAFSAPSTNLTADAPNGQGQAFLRDLRGGGNVLVSRADGPAGALSDNGNVPAGQYVWTWHISDDGRMVDFVATLPGAGGYYGYRRDVVTGTTTLLTAADDGTPVWSAGILVTAGGGRYVLFQTNQKVIDSLGALPDAGYVRDLQTGRSVLVTRADGPGGAPASGPLLAPTGLSPGGRYATFRSNQGDLSATPGTTASYGSFVYVRDLRLGRTVMASRADGRAGAAIAGHGNGYAPVTGDGCKVAFDANGTDIAAGSPGNGGTESYLRDLCAGTTTLVSRAGGGGAAAATPAPPGFGDAATWTQDMSADGRYVLFSTAAGNLADGLTGAIQTYVRDVVGDRTILVTRADGPNGTPDNANTPHYVAAAMTPDARYVAFESIGGGLVTDDTYGYSQIYRRELGAMPPAPTPVRSCGAIDDPGIGGSAAAPCPDGGAAGGGPDDGAGGAPGPGLPGTPAPVLRPVGSDGAGGASDGAPAAPGAGSGDAPAPVATAPTLVRAPTLSATTASAKGVRAWVDLPATVQVAVARQAARGRWTAVRTLKAAAARAGWVRVALPKLGRARYRLTIRALGAAGTRSPAIVRTVDLRPKAARR